MKKTRWIMAIVTLLFVGAIISFWYFQDDFFTSGFALRQATPQWAAWRTNVAPGADIGDHFDPSIPDISKPGILLRYSDETGSLLLLKHTLGQGIYSFDHSSYQTKPVPDAAWSNATGEVVVCETQRWRQQSAFNVDNMRYRLITWDDKRTPQPTYGKYAWEDVRSPSRKKTAILSAYGPKKPFINFGLPGLGGADITIHGQRYIQIMDLETKEYVAKPVRLWSDHDVPCFSSCWSSNDVVLVSYSCNFSDFQIAEPLSENETPYRKRPPDRSGGQ